MSKETEEIVLIVIVALFILKMAGGINGSAGNSLALAKLDAQTNLGYANAAAGVANSLISSFGD